MNNARKQMRNPQKLQVLLSPVEEPLLAELGFTENVSSHGLRVRTQRPWNRDTVLILLSSERDLWARASRVPPSPFRQGICYWMGAFGPDGRIDHA